MTIEVKAQTGKEKKPSVERFFKSPVMNRKHWFMFIIYLNIQRTETITVKLRNQKSTLL